MHKNPMKDLEEGLRKHLKIIGHISFKDGTFTKTQINLLSKKFNIHKDIAKNLIITSL